MVHSPLVPRASRHRAPGRRRHPDCRPRHPRRAGKAKLDAVLEASGWEALHREAHALAERGEEIDLQIERTVATSFAGVLAQIEVLRENFGDHALLDMIIAGVKRLAGGAA
jgi:hypothetical protein